jgi:hypothetical protein
MKKIICQKNLLKIKEIQGVKDAIDSKKQAVKFYKFMCINPTTIRRGKQCKK